MLGGRYDAGLHMTDNDWRTTDLTLTTVWSDGNQNLFTVAAAQSEINPDGRLRSSAKGAPIGRGRNLHPRAKVVPVGDRVGEPDGLGDLVNTLVAGLE